MKVNYYPICFSRDKMKSLGVRRSEIRRVLRKAYHSHKIDIPYLGRIRIPNLFRRKRFEKELKKFGWMSLGKFHFIPKYLGNPVSRKEIVGILSEELSV